MNRRDFLGMLTLSVSAMMARLQARPLLPERSTAWAPPDLELEDGEMATLFLLDKDERVLGSGKSAGPAKGGMMDFDFLVMRTGTIDRACVTHPKLGLVWDADAADVQEIFNSVNLFAGDDVRVSAVLSA